MNTRERAQPWHRWYSTSRWRRLRLDVFVRDKFICCSCGRIQSNTSLLVCDHKVPHRGSAVLFWDAANLQCMCKRCHDELKQQEEQESIAQRGVWY